MANRKLGVLLAITQNLASSFKASLTDYFKFFKSNQGDFLGIKKTYEPNPGTDDIPANRQSIQVTTTVEEKFDWLRNNSIKYLQALFDQEKTNASNVAFATLKLGEVDYRLSSLELLRLKSLLEMNELKQMLEQIPVRSDKEVWEKSENAEYVGREIWETPRTQGITMTTDKESHILLDPNVSRVVDRLANLSGYTPQVAIKTTSRELGNWSLQKFSGEITQREKAEILKKRSELLTLVLEALEEANNVESVASELPAEHIFDYLLG